MRRIIDMLQKLFVAAENIWAEMFRICRSKRASFDNPEIPNVVTSDLAQAILEALAEYYATDDGQAEYEEWLATRQETKKSEA